MWIQDWLRRFRSGKIVSVELTGRVDAAIANRQSTLEDADMKIFTHDDDNDFVVIYSDYCSQPSIPTNASHIETISIGACPQSDRQQLIKDCEQPFIPRASVHSMELCGRGDHNHTIQDLRSAPKLANVIRVLARNTTTSNTSNLVTLEVCIAIQLICLTPTSKHHQKGTDLF